MEHNDIVILELDRPRQLKLSHKVLKRFLAKTKIRMKNFDEAVDDYENLCYLIYEMLREDDPTLTLEACDELLDKVPIATIIQKSAEAIQAGFGTAEPAEENEENPTAAR